MLIRACDFFGTQSLKMKRFTLMKRYLGQVFM